MAGEALRCGMPDPRYRSKSSIPTCLAKLFAMAGYHSNPPPQWDPRVEGLGAKRINPFSYYRKNNYYNFEKKT
jgi:hypothetical protein